MTTTASSHDGYANCAFNQLYLNIGNGAMALSQLQRLVNGVTLQSVFGHNTREREFKVLSTQPLVQRLSLATTTTVPATAAAASLDDAIYNLIVQLVTWMIIKSGWVAISIPAVIPSVPPVAAVAGGGDRDSVIHVSPELKQRLFDTYNTLLITRSSDADPPLYLTLGDQRIDIEATRDSDDDGDANDDHDDDEDDG